MEIIGKDFEPPHCPRRNCNAHLKYDHSKQWSRWSTYHTQVTGKRIQRFKCHVCGGTYSRQAFSVHYWQKKHLASHELLLMAVGSACNRQIARITRLSHSTIDHHLARLGRHASLFHLKMIQNVPPPKEVVVDGFETFEQSQYYPMHFHLAIEKHSQFLWYFTGSPLRRKGRMTDYQKKRRQELEQLHGRPDPKAIEKDMAELLRVTLRDAITAVVYSDEHLAYPRAIGCLDVEIEHRTVSSKERRDKRNILWAVNLEDLLIRHSGANHKRETIAYAKRRNAAAWRLMLFMLWRNYIKGISEKSRGSPTPAMLLGLVDRRLTVEEILERRIFSDHVEMPPRWKQYYGGEVETAALAVNRRHALKFAF